MTPETGDRGRQVQAPLHLCRDWRNAPLPFHGERAGGRRVSSILPYLVLAAVLLSVLLLPSCTRSPAPTTFSPTTTPPPTSSTDPGAATATFDFDSGRPPSIRQGTPFNYTANGLTAHFGSQFDPGGYSVQDRGTTFFNLSQLPGKYLMGSNPVRNTLTVTFDRRLTSISMNLATIDYHDPGAGGTGTSVRLTAYSGSTSSAAVGSSTSQGAFSADTYPQWTISFNSPGRPFDTVTLEIVFAGQGATTFLVDNIVAQTAQ
jgi:hypothetical protein